MTETNNHQKADKKYRYTKQIIKFAIEAGYTNKEIAKKAGLSEKSIAQVSRWRKGESLATERQMRFFINEFSHQLKRKIEHLYTFVSTINQDAPLQYIKCTGDIILKHCCKQEYDLTYKKSIRKNVIRLVLIQDNNNYHLLFQYRLGCKLNIKNQTDFSIKIPSYKYLQKGENEEANWHTYKIATKLNENELLIIIDKFSQSLLTCENTFQTEFINDAKTIPFIIRQVLLKQGYQANDIIDVSHIKENNSQTQ